MANHKKKKHPSQRSHCHMCKPWKDGRISRDNENFESYSAHKRRINLDEEILEYLEDEE
jgi:hypothetical protein